MSESCDNCRYRKTVECRRQPPYLASVSSGVAYAHTDRTGVWPVIKHDDWCGCWEARAVAPATAQTEVVP